MATPERLILTVALLSLRAIGSLPTCIQLSRRIILFAQNIILRFAVPTIGVRRTIDTPRGGTGLYRSVHRGSILLPRILLSKYVHAAQCRGEVGSERRYEVAFIGHEPEEGCTRRHTRNHDRCIDFYYAVTALDDELNILDRHNSKESEPRLEQEYLLTSKFVL